MVKIVILPSKRQEHNRYTTKKSFLPVNGIVQHEHYFEEFWNFQFSFKLLTKHSKNIFFIRLISKNKNTAQQKYNI